MARDREPWAPPLVEMTATGIVGHLLAWEKNAGDRFW
jgi:hypothetical protein